MSTIIPISSPEEVLAKLNDRLTALVERGKAINVTDQSSCLAAKEFHVECNSYKTAVNQFCDGDIQDLNERLSKLRAAKKELLLPMESILTAVDGNRRAWEETERQAAEKEQVKAEKSGEYGETVRIRPAIPTLQGVSSQRRYKVAVENEDAVLQAWVKASRSRKKKDQMLAMVLRSYIRVDGSAIQAVARSEKGWNELREQKIPGLKFWTE